jgi:hypothetical protein
MPYMVVLGPAATRTMQSLAPFDQRELNRALNDELTGGPNADKEIRFDSNGHPRSCDGRSRDDTVCYTATPLSHKAYTAIHRPMTMAELSAAGTAQRDHVIDLGFYVLDILSAELAFELLDPSG